MKNTIFRSAGSEAVAGNQPAPAKINAMLQTRQLTPQLFKFIPDPKTKKEVDASLENFSQLSINELTNRSNLISFEKLSFKPWWRSLERRGLATTPIIYLEEYFSMPNVDWSYHRPGWKTCVKTQEFLANAGVIPKTETNAKKETYQKQQALELVEAASHLFVARGKKVVELNLKKDAPTETEVLKLILGPTGNLRAPTLKCGKQLIVGFNDEMYEGIFG